ncbi:MULTISPECIES: CdaR family protein [Clostridium]|uniref:CdaR family protein n=1 Tax=Clostridium TaxID=1485 RepID=UPI0008254C46|nr:MULTISPECIES: CdaR family protein [Clostridium]PJI08927.1 YbbR-like domain-containing protein [Clostridium sp. CT7]
MDTKTKKEIVVRIMCFLAAFGLWMYITNYENPIKTYKIKNIPVTINNTDSLKSSNLTLAPNQKFEITLTIKGNAADIYKVKAGEFKIVADISSYAVKQGENNIPVQIIKSPDNVNVVQGDNMWVSVRVDKIEKKSVAVAVKKQGKTTYLTELYEAFSNPSKANISGASEAVSTVDHVEATAVIKSEDEDTFTSKAKLTAIDAKGNIVNGVEIEPKNIDITLTKRRKVKSAAINVVTTGQPANGVKIKSITPSISNIELVGTNDGLSNISSINTEAIDLSKISAAQTLNVKLVVPDGIKLANSDNTVSVNIVTDNIIQKSFSVNISTVNLGANLKSQMASNTVGVVVSGYQSVINGIKDGDIKASVDLSNLSEGTYSLPINLTLPSGVTKVSQTTDKINVTITK